MTIEPGSGTAPWALWPVTSTTGLYKTVINMINTIKEVIDGYMFASVFYIKTTKFQVIKVFYAVKIEQVGS